MLSIRQPHFFHLNNFNTKHCLRLVFALARKDIQFTQKKKPCLKDEFFKNKICCYQLCIKKKKKLCTYKIFTKTFIHISF